MSIPYSQVQNLTSPSSFWTSLPSSLRAYSIDKMPSIRSVSTFAVAAAQAVLGLQSPVARDTSLVGQSATCNNKQLSCHNKTVVENLCCFNSPGGSILQTQFWDFNPATGPDDSWTIHGLWPDNCDGTYEQYCDESRQYTNISDILKADGYTDLLSYMNTYWASNTGTAESFWEHEWGKHGTCMSTFDTKCYSDYQPTDEVPDYFQKTVDLFKSLPSYDLLKAAGIVPSTTKTYSLASIQKALKAGHGKKVYVGCTDNNELDELWYFFNVRGSIQTGQFVAAPPLTDSSCPKTGIKYLPKGSTSPSPTATTTTTAPTSTSTGGPFEGKGYLNVITSGSKKGCIISGGTWYTTGTCAGFTTTTTDDGFTLTSSKGLCAVQDGKLTCAAGVTEGSTFSADGSDLSFNGTSSFHADAVPTGSVQAPVYVSADGHAVELTIEWQGI